MKFYLFNLILVLVLFSASVHAQKDFAWFANDHFAITDIQNTTKIEIKKMAWEAFTLASTEQDLSNHPFLSFKIKSDADINLRVDVLDQQHDNLTINPIIKKISGSNHFVELKYDFKDMKDLIDLEKISHFQFFVNPGEKYNGTIFIKEIKIGTISIHQLKPDEPSISFFPNPIVEQLTIDSKHLEFDEIKIMDALGKQVFSKSISPTNKETFHLRHLPSGIFSFELMLRGKSIYVDSFVRQTF